MWEAEEDEGRIEVDDGGASWRKPRRRRPRLGMELEVAQRGEVEGPEHAAATTRVRSRMARRLLEEAEEEASSLGDGAQSSMAWGSGGA